MRRVFTYPAAPKDCFFPATRPICLLFFVLILLYLFPKSHSCIRRAISMYSPTTQIAAWIEVIGFSGMICFQVLLALGAPLGKAAWGGHYQKLPASLRLGSILAVGIYLLGSFFVMEKAGLLITFNKPVLSGVFVWILVGIFGFSFIGNLLSESKLE